MCALSTGDSFVFVQRTLLVQAYRPFAFWASVSCDNEEVIARVRDLNAGVAQDKEVIRPALIKDYAVLTVQDLQQFNVWLLAQSKVTYKDVRDQLGRLRHRRWAWWHVMCSDNPNVAPQCSMPLPFCVR